MQNNVVSIGTMFGKPNDVDVKLAASLMPKVIGVRRVKRMYDVLLDMLSTRLV